MSMREDETLETFSLKNLNADDDRAVAAKPGKVINRRADDETEPASMGIDFFMHQ
jgi:hypothetical protein